MKTKSILASLAVASLAFAQPAAAATRSFESLPSKGLELGWVERAGSATDSAEGIGTEIAPGIIIVGILLIAGLIILITSNGSDSPG